MASIEIILRDKNGQVLNRVTAESYDLGQDLATVSKIEGAIDQFKSELLPALEADLLTHQQEKTVSELKKADR